MISCSLFKVLPTKLAHLKLLSTLPSVSEAVEALEHIVDEDRKLKTITTEESLAKKQLLRPTLDRNRVISSPIIPKLFPSMSRTSSHQ